MDFASITYLPETRSKSESNLVRSFTKDLTLSIEFKEIFTVTMIIPSCEYDVCEFLCLLLAELSVF